MKKILILMLMAAMVLPVFASSGDTMNIGGVVPLILTLVVAPTADSDNLDLVAATNANTVLIANTTITTNNTAGWELWITSVNSDAGTPGLINDDGDDISYTLTYAGTGTTTSAVTANTGNMYGEADTGAAVYSETSTLSINYSQEPDYYAGYYSDQITLVLRAK